MHEPQMHHDAIPRQYEYKAFISYRHVPRDTAAAAALHSQIERYQVPASSPKEVPRTEKKWKVFRDNDELRITHDLPQSIHEALDASEYLIVICSPEAVDSRWVPLEVAYFLRHHSQDHVLTVVTAGDPAQLIPKLQTRITAMRVGQTQLSEPLFLDIRAGSHRTMKRLLKERFLKLAATLHGCAYDDLVMREQRRRRTQFLQRLAAVVCFFLSIIAVLLWSNYQITAKNQELEQQHKEILLRESEILTDQALDALSEGDHFSAIKYAVSALPSPDNDCTYYIPAEQALLASLGIPNNQSDHYFFSKAVIKSNMPISDFCITSDGSGIAYIDQYGTVYFYDIQDEQVLWKQHLSGVGGYRGGTILHCSETDSVIVSFQNSGIASLSCDSGNVQWFYHAKYPMDIRPLLSPDQQIIIFHTISPNLSEASEQYTQDGHLLIISTGSGEVLHDINLSEQLHIDAYQLDLVYAGRDIYEGITADNTTYISYYLSDDTIEYFSVDLTSGTADVIHHIPRDDFDFSYLFFTDGGTQCAAILSGFSRSAPVRIMKFELRTGEILWTADLATLQDSPYRFSEELYYYVSEHDLVVAQNNTFMVYDLHSGEPGLSVEFESYVEHLFRIDENSYGVILGDGSFIVINMAVNDFGENVLIVEEICSLGLDIDNLIYCNPVTYTTALLNGSAAETNYDPDGNLVIAAINFNDLYNIEISRRMPIDDMLAPKQVQLAEAYDNIWHAATSGVDGQYIVLGPFTDYIMDEDLALLGTECFYKVIDANNLQPVCRIPVSGSDDPIYFLPDGSGYIISGAMYDFHGNIVHQSMMLDRYDHQIATVNNAPLYVHTNYPQGHLEIWYEDTIYHTAQVPEEFLYHEWDFCLGNNGYLVCSPISFPPDQQIYWDILDIFDNEWFRIPTDHTVESFYPEHVFCIGNVSPLMAFQSRQGNLCIYNCDDGSLVNEFSIDIPSSSLMNMQFIVDDAYLMLQSEEGLLLFLDVASGTVVYNEVIYPNSYSNFILQPYYDRQEQRLFIKGDLNYNSICLDTVTWTKLVSIPSMLGYDSETNMVFQTMTDPETAEETITASYFPSSGELIEIARSLVEMDVP